MALLKSLDIPGAELQDQCKIGERHYSRLVDTDKSEALTILNDSLNAADQRQSANFPRQ